MTLENTGRKIIQATAVAGLILALTTTAMSDVLAKIDDVFPEDISVQGFILDRDGKVNSCVCFVAKKSVIEDEKRRTRLVELLQETAQSISMALGWRPGVISA